MCHWYAVSHPATFWTVLKFDYDKPFLKNCTSEKKKQTKKRVGNLTWSKIKGKMWFLFRGVLDE